MEVEIVNASGGAAEEDQQAKRYMNADVLMNCLRKPVQAFHGQLCLARDI